jgi:predicted amidophosphoribosyltransferase
VERLIDLVLPPRCASCAAAGWWPLCAECTAGVAVASPPWCERCGRPTEVALRSCADCPPGPVHAVRAPFLYGGPIARAIKGMKFGGWHALGSHLAGAMAEVCGLPGDLVTWVPLSRRRLRARGFDQAEVLARAVAPVLQSPVRSLLTRAGDIGSSQARRPGADRRRALAGAFAPVGPVRGDVILVDDVITTGSTAAACARALLGAGAGRVSVLAAARSLGGPVPARCRGVGAGEAGRVP